MLIASSQHGHYLYLRLIPTEQSEFALVLAHGPVGNPLPPPDVSENAGVINEAVTKAAAIITKKLGMKNKESTKPRDEL